MATPPKDNDGAHIAHILCLFGIIRDLANMPEPAEIVALISDDQHYCFTELDSALEWFTAFSKIYKKETST